MRLLEEKSAVDLQIISIVFILFSTVVIGILDCQESKYNESILKSTLQLSRIHQIRNDQKLNANFYTLFGALHLDIKGVGNDVPDEVVNELAMSLKDGRITQQQFYDKFISHTKLKSKALLMQYNVRVKQLNQLIMNGRPWWLILRNFFFVPLQFIGIIILVYGNISLSMKISRRTKRREQL